MKKNVLRSLFAFTALSVSTATLAATDQATSTITLTVPTSIEIAQLGDIGLTPSAGSDAVGSDAFCIAGTGFGTFAIQFDSNAGGSSFLLSDGTDTVPYSVEFANSLNDADYATMTATNGDGGHGRNGASCSGTDNAQVRVTVAQADWEAMNGISYSDTLTVTVTTE